MWGNKTIVPVIRSRATGWEYQVQAPLAVPSVNEPTEPVE